MASTQALLLLSFIQLAFCVYRHVIPVIPNDLAIVLNGGNSQATVKVEFFMDLACPDSKRNFNELRNAVAGFKPDQVQVELYQFLLPWHRNAFVVSKGLYFVYHAKPEKTLAYIEKVFDTIPEFGTDATQDKSELEVVRALSKISSEVTGINEDDLYTNITSNRFKNKVRLCNKLAYQRGAKGTPWIFVNGAETLLGTQDNWFITSSEWVNMFNQVLKDSTKPQVSLGKLVCSTSGSMKLIAANYAFLLAILIGVRHWP